MAEFELAIKALDTYIEIVNGAKDRASHSANRIGDLESDDIFARTLSEGVIVLGCFGGRNEAEKAMRLVETLEILLDKLPSESSGNGSATEERASESSDQETTNLSPETIPLAFRAVGIGLANWARWTPVSESRTEIQESALSALEKSLDSEPDERTDIATNFALGSLLAETRDLDGAIDCIRTTLIFTKSMDETYWQKNIHMPYTRERDLVPLWHLLALLLSAKEDFETATYACEAAFETLPTANIPFQQDGQIHSKRSKEGGSKSKHWLSSTKSEHPRGIIGEMEYREKESIVELRITQLALTEILQGPESALNHSDELLKLFGRLFADVVPHAGHNTDKVPDNLAPPKSSAGTTRSFRSSIFGRKRSIMRSGPGSDVGNNAPRARSTSALQPQRDADAPAIQVTNEDQQNPQDKSPTSPRKSSLRGKESRTTPKRDENLSKSTRHRSPDGIDGFSSPESTPNKTHGRYGAEDGDPVANDALNTKTNLNGSSSARQTLPYIAHNMKPTKQPAPAGHANQPPTQDVRLPITSRFDSPTGAVTRLSRTQAQKHALTLLVKIWLFIAELYRRASLFEDAREACNEASDQVTRMENLISTQESSARAFANAGWGVRKSSDELWADIKAELGNLAQEQAQPHEAMRQFEEALTYDPDNSSATVGLCNLLLDIFDEKLPTEEPESNLEPHISSLSVNSDKKQDEHWPLPASEPAKEESAEPSLAAAKHTAETRNRFASRDRAYGLLTTLTKLGSGWDNSEAWLALSRAYEQSEQITKAKEVLWWVIELEDRRPVRHWSDLGSGGYVL